MSVKRKRVKAYVDALSQLLLLGDPSREKAVELVKEHLEKEGLEPLRGASKPDDIYEKELISLYIIASRGLGIVEEYRELIQNVFEKELLYEKVIQLMRSEVSNERVREVVLEMFPKLSESDVARILRFALTLYYLDFESYDYVIEVIRRFKEVFPEFEDTIRRFVKWLIAVKLSEEISAGKIRDRVEKEIRKQILSMDSKIPKSTPSDEYVAKVARVVYDIPERIIKSLLGVSRSEFRRSLE